MRPAAVPGPGMSGYRRPCLPSVHQAWSRAERKGEARTGPRIQGRVSREATGAGWAWGLRAGVWVKKVFAGNDGPRHTLPADSPVDPGPIRGQAPTPEGRRQGGAGPALLTSPTASHTAAQDRLPLSNLQPSCCSFCPDLSRRPQQGPSPAPLLPHRGNRCPERQPAACETRGQAVHSGS